MKRHLRISSAALVTASLIASVLVATNVRAQIPLLDKSRPSLAPMLKTVTPAVVNISVVGEAPVNTNPLLNDPFFRRFFNVPDDAPRSVPTQAVGSGIVIDAKQGYVLTNFHVIRDAKDITVTLADKRRLTAKLVGSDEDTDIALLDVDADGLTQLDMGDSDSLEVGDFVVAIGNPFGLGQTVTSGIVSALGRTGLGIEGYEDFIQTDASINPGNSGGALVDLDGDLIGLNTAIVSPSGGGNVGIGFAVPINMVRQVMDQLIEHGEVRRGRLGVYIQDLTPDLAEALGLDVVQGAIVTEVEPGSSAERAGIETGDVIIALDDVPIEGSADLRNRVGLAPAGSDARITFLRDGRRQVVRATVEAQAGATASAGGAPQGGGSIERLRGAQFGSLTPSHPLYGRVTGVLVVRVDPGSPAALAGLEDNDVITAVNRVPVASVDDLSRAVREAGVPFALNIARGGGRLFLVIR